PVFQIANVLLDRVEPLHLHVNDRRLHVEAGVGGACIRGDGPVSLAASAQADRVDFVPAGNVFRANVNLDAIRLEGDAEGYDGNALFGADGSGVITLPDLDFLAVEPEDAYARDSAGIERGVDEDGLWLDRLGVFEHDPLVLAVLGERGPGGGLIAEV